MDRSSQNDSQFDDLQDHSHHSDDLQYNAELQAEADQQEDVDYEDVFEEARREEVLREINQGQSHSEISDERNEEVEAILERRAKREEKKEEDNKKNQMKRLRQQNALEFFKKVKMEMLLNFRDSIFAAQGAINNSESKVCRLLSCCKLDLIKAYQHLKAKPQELRKRKDFKELIANIFSQNQIQVKEQSKYEVIWGLAISLGLGFRKICFIDISSMDLQSFYNLKYMAAKGKKKNINKQLDILKNRLQRKVTEQQLKDRNFISIEEYSFNPKTYANTRISASSDQTQQSQSSNTLKTGRSSLSHGDRIREMKRTFHNSFCQIYCPVEKNWQLFNMQILQSLSITEVKNTILENKAIIAFYSVRAMQFMDKFKHLKQYRLISNIELRDQTNDFCDKLQLIFKRRLRLGCKGLYRTAMRELNVFKNLQIFTEFQKNLIESEDKKQKEQALARFPKSVKEMRASDYFVTPSLVEKYMIIKEGAQPIPNIEFHEERVYFKTDLQKVSSRMGWIDCSRMVKQNQIPVKTTQNKNKTTTKLYKYSQTEPFKFKLNEEGDFILDEEYNSIYVPPVFQIPPGFVLIPENVEYLCKRNKYKCARIVQGFDVAGSHIVPNNIGYLVEGQYQEKIEKMFKERQQKLLIKKQQRKTEGAMALWRKLFKSIIITQQVRSNI